MKLAVVTEDGITVHSHFGQAPYFEVFTIEGKQITGRERRDKPSHGAHHNHGSQEHQHAGDSHAGDMAAVIADCEVVLARGMGEPAFRRLQAAGIQPLLIQEQSIDEAVQAYLRGELKHDPKRIHMH